MPNRLLDLTAFNVPIPSYLDHVTEIRLEAEAAQTALLVFLETTYCSQLR